MLAGLQRNGDQREWAIQLPDFVRSQYSASNALSHAKWPKIGALTACSNPPQANFSCGLASRGQQKQVEYDSAMFRMEALPLLDSSAGRQQARSAPPPSVLPGQPDIVLDEGSSKSPARTGI